MSPKYIPVLLLALVLAATSLAANPSFRGGSKPPHHGPTEEASLQEQENSQVNNYVKPPHKGHPPEQDNSQVNGYPYKPPHKKHPPEQDTHKPPHGPPHNSATEELYQEEKENSELDAYPPKHKKHPPKEDNPQFGPHKPSIEDLSQEEKENSEVNIYPPKHRKHPPNTEGIFRHKPPHGPPQKQTTEELPLQQQKGVSGGHAGPGHGHPHVVEEDQKKEVDNIPRHRPPHHPPRAN